MDNSPFGETVAVSRDPAAPQARSVRPLRPLRVAQVTATFPPYHGGTGNVCYHNAVELVKLGHEVHVFTVARPGAPRREECDGLTIHRLRPLVRAGNAALLPGLLWALRGFDVIHLHYPFFGGEVTTLAARLYRIPLVITYHQDVFLDGLHGLIERVMRRSAGRATLRAAARLLFTSLDYGQASYIRPLLQGREEAIDELPNGVDLATYTPGEVPADLRARHNLLCTDKVALLVAGLDKAHYFKGVDVFLSALAWMPPHVKGVIVGDGDLRETYQVAARVLGVDSRVSFAGRVSKEDLPRYYRLADVTVLPSVTMGEAFGLVLVESLASGTPVVASDLPGVRTVVTHGSDGLLADPNNPASLAGAIGWILRYEGRQHVMGMSGRMKVEQAYDWRQIGRRLESVYGQVLAHDTKAPVWHLRRGKHGTMPLGATEQEIR